MHGQSSDKVARKFIARRTAKVSGHIYVYLD